MRHPDPDVQRLRVELALALCTGGVPDGPGGAERYAEYMATLATRLAVLLVAVNDGSDNDEEQQ